MPTGFRAPPPVNSTAYGKVPRGEHVPVLKHRGFPEVHCSTESRRTTYAGAAFHDGANCTGKGPPHRGPFRFQCTVKREPPPGLNLTMALFPRTVPSSTVTTSPRFRSGVNRKGCSPSGTLSTHDRHTQEQHQYVWATDREARINRKPARLHANDRMLSGNLAPSRRNWLFCRALDCSVDEWGFSHLPAPTVTSADNDQCQG